MSARPIPRRPTHPGPYVEDWRAYAAAIVVAYGFIPAGLYAAAWFSRWALSGGGQ